MPKSRLRKRTDYTPPTSAPKRSATTSPRWLAPAMVTCFLLGLAWIVTYYVSQARYPIPGIEAWNMAVGFAFVIAGFGLATQWK